MGEIDDIDSNECSNCGCGIADDVICRVCGYNHKIFEISLSAYNSIVSTARNSINAEICGLLIGKNGIGFNFMEIENISKELKLVNYVMHPNQMMNILQLTNFLDKNTDVEWHGIVHSHPNSYGYPSPVDLDRAEYNVIYFIYGLSDNVLRAWSLHKDDEGNKSFEPKDYRVI